LHNSSLLRNSRLFAVLKGPDFTACRRIRGLALF
jgi:hypothetical protein